MAKRSRTRPSDVPATGGADQPSPRQPCPCGSGKRYKACHGSQGGAPVYVRRPLAGVPGECDLVAMREFVPSATLPLHTADGEVLACSLLPGAAPAMRRADDSIWLGLQVHHAYGDVSRDLAAAIEAARATTEADAVGLPGDPGPGARLQDLVTGVGEVEVHDGFDWWVAENGEELDEAARSTLDEANGLVAPTRRLDGVQAAYWSDVTSKEYLRWAMPEDEDPLLDALARLHVRGDDVLVEGSRLVGMFRAAGLLVPVWDLEPGTGGDVLTEPAAAFRARLDEVLADGGSLTSEERSARAGLANRQVTLR